ncbi:SNF2 family N-terminal domain-containing protein [Xylaria digitata]|nr:SNF2 family N-terminal domain-containing protein [Xylaria digitata]
MRVIQSQLGFLDALKSRDDLHEAQQPTAIRSTLKRHQKQALTFMVQREKGWNFDQEYIDIWEAHHTDLSNTYQNEEPPEFRGGVIADTMGLGKTLTMIALVAADLDNPREQTMNIVHDVPGVPEVETSLIIIPPPLLDTWEEQLSEHLFDNRLKWCRHHAKHRITSFDELREQHVVLTTYHTVSAEWKGAKNAQNSLLFSVRWKRIILDEAHFIRNARSTMSRAVCALDASSRWAVSGTPVQNRLSDLASLLKFIRATPYDDMKQFDAAISSLWKSGEDEEAVRRLQYLSACLLLRRSKEAIDLPQKRDLLCPVDFSPDERVAYENLRQQAIRSIDEAVYGHHGNSGQNNHANALQKIESLRLFSDLGLQYHARHEPHTDQDWPRIAQQAFNSRRAIEPLICMDCSLSLDFAESLLDEPTALVSKPQFSSCMKFVCSECTRTLNRGNRTLDCGHKPACPFASVSTGGDAFEEIPDSLSLPLSPTRLSSKVEALITDLKSLPPNTKCVVFSTWRLTLDLVEAGLDQHSIQHIRFDGKVPQNERGAVISRFRTEPRIRVMLLTLSCGAVGLTLTVASRAYLMEPHWNPTLEEQALARIHRLGQTQQVTTVRLYIRNSFEEEVIKVQESKKQLANVLLQPHDGGSAGDNLSTLQGLRSLL